MNHQLIQKSRIKFHLVSELPFLSYTIHMDKDARRFIYQHIALSFSYSTLPTSNPIIISTSYKDDENKHKINI